MTVYKPDFLGAGMAKNLNCLTGFNESPIPNFKQIFQRIYVVGFAACFIILCMT
jgi:hypothetical protein